jgi:hypothetical protein
MVFAGAVMAAGVVVIWALTTTPTPDWVLSVEPGTAQPGLFLFGSWW